LTTWNFFDKWMSVGHGFPVLRARAPVTAPTSMVQ
jgi:hypothetical protein